MSRPVGYKNPTVWVGDKKRCCRCGAIKPYSDFATANANSSGLSADCKECRRKISLKYKRTPAYVAKARERALLKKYNLTIAQVDALLASQGNCCAVCGDNRPGGRYDQWAVDHDHDYEKLTGKIKVRGILCNACNWILGHAKDKVQRLLKAAAYLDKTEKSFYAV
jgi:hypothetical protein